MGQFRIVKIWEDITEFGVSEDRPEESQLTRLFNRMLFMSLVFSVLVFGLALFFDLALVYYVITIFVGSSYGLALLLNYFHKIYATRLILAVYTPLWVSLAHLLIGGFFSQSVVILATMVVNHVAFQHRPQHRNWLHVLIVGMYLLALIYGTLNEPILKGVEFPYDEIVLFLAGVGWTMSLVLLYEKEKETFIKSLWEKNRELQNTTQELERFTYIASHDLKSPLRTISSFVDLIERDIKRGNYEAIGEKLRFAKTGAKQMSFLIEGILELSKVKDIKKSDRILIDLNVVLEKARMNLLDDVTRKKATIQSTQLPQFLGNEVEFLLLFQNFIQNGIKYNESETPVVSITAAKTDSHLSLCFKDNGIGIDEAYHQQIFEFFKRLHSSNEYQGTGLGLGLCKRIIDNYNGTIQINSVKGQGTTFTLVFPLVADPNKKQEQYSSPLFQNGVNQ